MSHTINYETLRLAGACDRQLTLAARLYPHGIPITLTAAQALMAAGCDVIYGALLLLAPVARRDFVAFTLRQRQPHIAALLRRAGLAEHAAAVEALGDGLREAVHVYEAAWRGAVAVGGDRAAEAAGPSGPAAASAACVARAGLISALAASSAAWDARASAYADAGDGAMWVGQVDWCLAKLRDGQQHEADYV